MRPATRAQRCHRAPRYGAALRRRSFGPWQFRACRPAHADAAARAPRRSARLLRRLYAPGARRRAQRKRGWARGVLISTPQVANEPSVGLYFVQEHVRKSIPFVIATKVRARAPGGRARAPHPSESPHARLPVARRAASATPPRRRTCASAFACCRAAIRRCAACFRRTAALTRASLFPYSPRRLDVDAGLETMKLVRDVGSPSLHRRAPRCAAPQRRR